MELLALTLLLIATKCDLVIEGQSQPGAYLELANRYRDGDRKRAVRHFADLSQTEIEAEILQLENVSQKSDENTFGPGEECLHAASLLHTEAGIAALDRSDWKTATFQFDSAWRVSSLIPSPLLKNRFQRDWLLAVGLAYNETIFITRRPDVGFTEADRIFASAVTRYPEDPEVLLAHGALLEWAGSLHAGDPAHLKKAESLYQRALSVEPGNADALVRYGWTLKRLLRDAEAVAAFEQVLALPAESNLIYRTRMGLGALAERTGQTEEAVIHYQEACRVSPNWQVGHIALSHALHVSGAHTRAREVLADALRLDSSTEALDGWWKYELGLVPRLDPLLARMRAEAKN